MKDVHHGLVLSTDTPVVVVDPPRLWDRARASTEGLLGPLLQLAKPRLVDLAHGGGDALVRPPLSRNALGFQLPPRDALGFQYRVDAAAREGRLDVTIERIQQQLLKLPNRARR